MFEIGTKVKVVGRKLVRKGCVGVITKVNEKAKGWPYEVTFPQFYGEHGEYAADEIEKAK